MSETKSISIDELIIGAVADDSLYDDRGVLLVPKGLQITDALIATLRRRGVTSLKAVSNHVETESKDALSVSTARAYSSEQVQRIRGSFEASASLIETLVRSVDNGGQLDLRRTDEQVDNFIGELVDDPDPVIAGALEYEANLKLATRCIQLSVLGMAIGLRLGLGRGELRKLGSAAMIHDWGLFDLPITARFPHQEMNPSQRQQFLRHPIVAKEMLAFTPNVDPDIKIIVAQVHELLDGSGFPMRLPAAQIHPLSRVMCVADAYLTMTSPPKGCTRIVPCDAIAYLISGASRGQYSAKAVNGLLRAVTTYPIGSIVELSDTTRARVIRSDGDDYAFPIVESLDDRARVIRLKDERLFIARPIVSPELNEVRLPDTYESLSESVSHVSV